MTAIEIDTVKAMALIEQIREAEAELGAHKMAAEMALATLAAAEAHILDLRARFTLGVKDFLGPRIR